MQALKSELATMRTEMITKHHFEDLEGRVHVLEQNFGSESNPMVKYLQNQLDKLKEDVQLEVLIAKVFISQKFLIPNLKKLA